PRRRAWPPLFRCTTLFRSPVDEVRQLGVGDEPLDADLLPDDLVVAGRGAIAVDGLALQALLDARQVVDADDPAHPAAAHLAAGADRKSTRLNSSHVKSSYA